MLGSGYESDNSSMSFHSTVESHFAAIEVRIPLREILLCYYLRIPLRGDFNLRIPLRGTLMTLRNISPPLTSSPQRSPSDPLALYAQGMDMVNRGLVKCRTDRTAMLACSSEYDFLAKVFAVRMAFDELVKSEANRNNFKQAGRDVMVSFLRSANQVDHY